MGYNERAAVSVDVDDHQTALCLINQDGRVWPRKISEFIIKLARLL